ncbi:MAG: aminotransferase class IV family protein [Phycisphaerales bacterium]|nr:aminotransferase class IV family protein [Phycisphaerales bacterium]
MREWASINGKLTPADQAQVSVYDSGFMQGVGLFETMRAYDGRVFRLNAHLARLTGAARQLGWSAIPPHDELRRAVEQVLDAVEQSDARVRLTVTTGSLRATESDTPRLTIVTTATPGIPYPDELYAKGATAVISKYRQSRADPTTGFKTTSYFSRLAALRIAHAAHAFEALWMTPENHLAEGSISNLFLVKDAELLTPSLETPVLPGITRAAVLEAAEGLGIPIVERGLSIDDLLAADEVFITNSLMEIVPIVRIEREPIATEKVGEITARLRECYADFVREECLSED